MNNACPECGAVYNVARKDIGRRVACRRCRAPLVVTERGLERDDVVAAEPAGDDDPRSTLVPRAPGFFSRLRNLADVPTCLFGAGVFCVIFFLFAPLIDQGRVARREASLAEAELDKARRLRVIRGDAERKKFEENWTRDTDELRDEVDLAKAAAARATYWGRHGMLFGFMLLAFGSLGYVTHAEPGIRRVVGAVVLCALLISVFVSVIFLQRP